MEVFCKLMDNKWFAFVYGIVAMLLGYVGVIGEPNALVFGFSFALLLILVKEIVNNQMCFNPFNKTVVLSEVLGSVLTTLILLCF